MSSISSSAYYSVSSTSSNGGISGLMSGMDTDAMVEEMLAGTQAKIDAQKGMEMQTEWKQEMYRDIIDQINDFSSKYFDSSYGASSINNLFSENFFNNMSSVITDGSALKIIGTSSSAYAGDMNVLVKQLATASKLITTHKLSGSNSISGSSSIVNSEGNSVGIFSEENLTEMFNKDVVLNVNGTQKTINLNGATTESAILERFQDALDTTGVSVSVSNGLLKFSDPSKVSVVDSSTDLGLEITGLTVGNLSNQYAKIDTSAGYSFDVTFDGVTKTITLNDVESADTTITAQEFEQAIKEKMQSAFGSYLTVEIDGTRDSSGNVVSDAFLKFSVTNSSEPGHEIKITGLDAKSFGITPGTSSIFSTSQSLNEIGNSDNYQFTINGVDFSFDGDTSVASMISQINRSDAGVTVSYSTLTDTMKVEASSTGASYGITMSQTEGDILSKLFGNDVVLASSAATSSTLNKNSITAADIVASDYTTTTASFNITVNGTDYTFTLPEKENDETYTRDEVVKELNTWLTKSFGIDDSGDSNIQYEIAADGTAKLNTKAGFSVSFKENTANLDAEGEFDKIAKSDLGVALGLTTANTLNNTVSSSTLASDIAGVPSTATGTISDLVAELTTAGLTASFSDGKISITGGTGDVNLSPALSAIFGSDTLSFGNGSMVGGVTSGTDSILVIDGIETTRSSNTFTVDGITMQATKVSTGDEATSISTTRNDDAIVETMKEFIEDYNKLIGELNDMVDEDPSYRDYPPLTAAQKKEMTDNEIELWEEKSKEGLLRNDSYINGFLSEMRTIIYSLPEGASIAAYQIGIETTSNYEDGGKLQFDETAFRNALSSDPDAISELFAGPNGLASMLEDAAKKVANTSSASPGSLVSLAGVSGLATEENNELSRQLLSIQERIETLEARYETEQARYWSQFTAMETAMNSYNSQSMMLSSQFGSGYY